MRSKRNRKRSSKRRSGDSGAVNTEMLQQLRNSLNGLKRGQDRKYKQVLEKVRLYLPVAKQKYTQETEPLRAKLVHLPRNRSQLQSSLEVLDQLQDHFGSLPHAEDVFVKTQMNRLSDARRQIEADLVKNKEESIATQARIDSIEKKYRVHEMEILLQQFHTYESSKEDGYGESMFPFEP